MMAFVTTTSLVMIVILYMIHGYHCLLPPNFAKRVMSSVSSSSRSNFNGVSMADGDNEFSIQEFDYNQEEKLPWNPTGYKIWKWRDYNINYVDIGGDQKKPPLLLIHGFGASVFHWRYNLPALARKYHVFAIDLLGFGLSDKPLITYTADVWRDQILDFISQVVRQSTDLPVVVAGNSLGGYSALFAASAERATSENLVNGCVLLNAAGRFRPLDGNSVEKKPNELLTRIAGVFQRFVIWLSFIYTKQPARITQVLKSVYPVDQSNIDEELVESIRVPSLHPNAAEVFYRIITQNGNGPRQYLDDLLSELKVPLMLLWGMKVSFLNYICEPIENFEIYRILGFVPQLLKRYLLLCQTLNSLKLMQVTTFHLHCLLLLI